MVLLLSGVAVVALLASACGGDDENTVDSVLLNDAVSTYAAGASTAASIA